MNIIIDYDFNIHIKKVEHIQAFKLLKREFKQIFLCVYTYVSYKMIWSIIFVEQFNYVSLETSLILHCIYLQ